jgi:hypothetical protein
MIDATILCYRLLWHAHDEERVWQFVDRHQGFMQPTLACIDFWIPRQYSSLLVLAFPRLIRRSDLDYI